MFKSGDTWAVGVGLRGAKTLICTLSLCGLYSHPEYTALPGGLGRRFSPKQPPPLPRPRPPRKQNIAQPTRCLRPAENRIRVLSEGRLALRERGNSDKLCRGYARRGGLGRRAEKVVLRPGQELVPGFGRVRQGRLKSLACWSPCLLHKLEKYENGPEEGSLGRGWRGTKVISGLVYPGDSTAQGTWLPPPHPGTRWLMDKENDNPVGGNWG